MNLDDHLIFEAYEGEDDNDDLEGDELKIGETNFPHGHGYPGIKRNYEKIVNLNSIYFKPKTEEEVRKIELKQVQQMVAKIQKIAPYILSNKEFRKHLNPTNNHDTSPFPWTFNFYLHEFEERIKWIKNSPKDLKTDRFLRYNFGIYRNLYRNSKFSQDIQTLKEFLVPMFKEYDFSEKQQDINNYSNYPVYVSLYDITRTFGGHEEGGWYYDVWDMIKTIPAYNPSEIRKVADQLYSMLVRADLNGQPRIIVEDTPGSQSTVNNPPLQYS